MSMDTTGGPDRLSRILDEVEGRADASASPSPEAPPAPTSAGGSPLGGLGLDPNLLTSVLPSLLSALPKGTGAGKPTASPSSAPLDRHTALLCAVKPYLGARRQATAETVLRLCRIWDALNRAGISPAVLGNLLGGAASALSGDVSVASEEPSGEVT